jgi:hypothetical protein
MLSQFDEYPIHQTAEPIAFHSSSDRNVYDRSWFNGFAADGSYFFGLTMGVYPNRGILDCGFSVIRAGGRQYCLHASRRAPKDRGETAAGPLSIEVLEPMRKIRVRVAENESGITADLMFSTRTAAIREARQTLWSGTRRTMDATRYDQFGRWSGVVSFPEGTLAVDERLCLGIKDRSWGVRRYGEPEPAGPLGTHRPLFLWAPVFWNDHVTHAIFFDDKEGNALVREGIEAPLYGAADLVPAIEDGRDRRMATARHRVKYAPGTRLASHAEIQLEEHDGAVRTIQLTPILKFQQKGIGYGHPKWGHGLWRGDLSIEHECFDPESLDPLAMENIHVQQVVRASDGKREGIGILEQFIIGPYGPAGFESMLDGAKA